MPKSSIYDTEDTVVCEEDRGGGGGNEKRDESVRDEHKKGGREWKREAKG